MPNVPDITVSKQATTSQVIYRITFNEVSFVPKLFVADSKIICGIATVYPTTDIVKNSSMSVLGVETYSWVVVPAADRDVLHSAVIKNLIPGKTYFFRLSAKNSLGFGSKRLTRPPSLTVPITLPTLATQLEGNWAAPAVFVSSQSSVLVKIGPSNFDGGSLLT